MAKDVPHYKKDGTLHTGETHKMPDGSLHSGKTHTKSSVPVFHMEDLSKTAKEKAMKMYGSKAKAKPKKKAASKPKRKPMKKGY
jgi:hypothetical protein